MIDDVVISKLGNWEEVMDKAKLALNYHKIHILDSVNKQYTCTIYFCFPWYRWLTIERIKKNINAIDYDNYVLSMSELLEDWASHYNNDTQDLQLISLIDVVNSELERRSKWTDK